MRRRTQPSPFNSNKSPTRCNNFPAYYPDVYLHLNMFRAFSRPSSGAQWLQWQPLVLPSYRGDSRAVSVFGPRTQDGYHHDTKVKPEAATAALELLMMGGRTPETCWSVNKRQGNKMENCCIWLMIFLNCTMMHGLTNLKSTCCVALYTLRQIQCHYFMWQIQVTASCLLVYLINVIHSSDPSQPS